MLIKSNSCIYSNHSCPLYKSSLNSPTRQGCYPYTWATHISTHSPTPGISNTILVKVTLTDVHGKYLDSLLWSPCPCLADTPQSFYNRLITIRLINVNKEMLIRGSLRLTIMCGHLRWPNFLLRSKWWKQRKSENNNALTQQLWGR